MEITRETFRQASPEASRMGGIFLIVLGLIPIAVGSYLAYLSFQLVGNGRDAVATISGYESKECSRKRNKQTVSYTCYMSKIAFQTQDGTNIEGMLGDWRDYKKHSIGEKLNVIYNPVNPYEVKEKSFASIWGAPLGLLFMGGVFVAVGFAAYVGKIQMSQRTSRRSIRIDT